ncbi:MAG: hypothetical protein ACREJ2_00025 [Planctomycetota bacterium]
MAAQDGAASGSSQKLKPKLSKPMKKAGGISGKQAAAPKGTPGGESGKQPATGATAGQKTAGKLVGPAAATSGPAPKLSGKGPKVSGKAPKVSGKTGAVKSESSQSSSVLKVKKKKSSSSEGPALNPKKSSLRKSSPAGDEPIKPTDDLEPVAVGDGAESADESTTVAYDKPPAEDGEAADEATDAYELDEGEPAADAKGDADESGDGEEIEAVEEVEDSADEEKGDDAQEDEEKSAEDADAEAAAGEDEKAAGAGKGKKKKKSKDGAGEKSDEAAEGEKAAGAKGSARRLGRGSKRNGEAADAAAQARSSKRSAAQKQAGRKQAVAFLALSIATVVMILFIPVVLYMKGMWPFTNNRPKVENDVLAVPVYVGETFGEVTAEFTTDANPPAMLHKLNPDLPLDKPFAKNGTVKVVIPPQWNFKPTNGSSLIEHFLAVAEDDLAKDPPDIGSANRHMLLVNLFLKRFILEGDNTPATKQKYQSEVDAVAQKIDAASNPTSKPAASGGAANHPPTADQAKHLKELEAKVAPIDQALQMAHGYLASGDVNGARKQMKMALDTMDQLHSLPPEDLTLQVVENALDAESDLQKLYDEGDKLTPGEFQKAFPKYK